MRKNYLRVHCLFFIPLLLIIGMAVAVPGETIAPIDFIQSAQPDAPMDAFSPAVDPELINHQAVTNLSAPYKGWLYYRVVLPKGAAALKLSTESGKGDADLYLKKLARPTLLDYDFRHGIKGSRESITVTDPTDGEWVVGVYGYFAFSGLSLKADFEAAAPTPDISIQNGETKTNLSQNKGAFLYRKITVTNGATVLGIRAINGSGDANLYVRQGDYPTLIAHDFASTKIGNKDIVKIPIPVVGDYYIGLYAKKSFDGLNLTTSFIDNGKYGITTDQGYTLYIQNANNPDFIVLDVRTHGEYNDIHIEDAINMDYYGYNFHDAFNALDPAKTYLIHCRTENRSSQAAMMMDFKGFGNFSFMYGGITEWNEKGYPVIETAPPGPGP